MFESTFPLNVNQNTGRETKVIELIADSGIWVIGDISLELEGGRVGWLMINLPKCLDL